MTDGAWLNTDSSKWLAFAKNLPEKAASTNGKILRSIGLQATNRITLRTPRDTGVAQSGWIMTLQDLPGDSFMVVIDNNVPYIVFLEYGSSKTQAPKGMVRVTFNELRAAGLLSKSIKQGISRDIKQAAR